MVQKPDSLLSDLIADVTTKTRLISKTIEVPYMANRTLCFQSPYQLFHQALIRAIQEIPFGSLASELSQIRYFLLNNILGIGEMFAMTKTRRLRTGLCVLCTRLQAEGGASSLLLFLYSRGVNTIPLSALRLLTCMVYLGYSCHSSSHRKNQVVLLTCCVTISSVWLPIENICCTLEVGSA